MTELRVRTGHRRLLAVGLLVVCVAATAGCGVTATEQPTEVGGGAGGLVAGQQRGPAFGNTYVPPETADQLHSAKELVEAYFDAAAGGGDKMIERVEGFLTDRAKEDWKPEEGQPPTVVRLVSVGSPVRVDSDTVTVKVQGLPIGTLTAHGKIDPRQPGRSTPVDLGFTVTAVTNAPNQYRLDKVPGELYLRDSALRNPNWYKPNPVYFWDKDGKVLVPDVRYLPLSQDSNQRPTTIVDYLLDGPSAAIESAVQQLPEKTERRGLVLPGDGGLVVNLSANAVGDKQEDVDHLIGQLRWSLGNERVILQIEGKPRAAAKPEEYRAYNAAVRQQKVKLGVSDSGGDRGHVVVLTPGVKVPAILGSSANRNVVSAAINRDLNRAAFVRQSGGHLSLWVAGMTSDGPQERLVDLNTTITDIGRPTWVNGTQYFLVPVNGDLYSVNQGGDFKRMSREVAQVAGKVTMAATSPEGRRVAFIAGHHAYVSTVDPSTGSVNINRYEIAQQLTSAVGIGWTSEDRLLVIGSQGQGIVGWTISSDGAEARHFEDLDKVANSQLPGLNDLAIYPGTPGLDTYEIVARTPNGLFDVFPTTNNIEPNRDPASFVFYPS
jgi:hypothetical protein